MIKHVAYAFVAFSAAALLSGCTTTPTTTARPDKSIAVQYGDLDLSRPAGAETLLARVKMASKAVCGGQPDIRDLLASTRYQHCFDQAMANAVGFVNKPMVAQLYGKPIDAAVARDAINSNLAAIAATQKPADKGHESQSASR